VIQNIVTRVIEGDIADTGPSQTVSIGLIAELMILVALMAFKSERFQFVDGHKSRHAGLYGAFDI